MSTLKLSEPQSRSFYSQAKTKGVIAGFGSGKTTAAVAEVFDLLLRYPGIPQGYAAPTYGDIKSIWYPAIEDHCIKHGFKYSIHKSDHVITIKGLGNIVCRSMSNPDKIVGFEVGDFLLDELDILKKEVAMNAFRKCKARCRKKYPKKRLPLPFGEKTKKQRKRNQLRIFTTPEGFKATYQIFKKDKPKNSELIQMSTYSNLHNLPDDYIEELMNTYPPQLVQAYILGQFTNLTSGTVYDSFDRYLNNAPGIFPLKKEILHIGMDFNVQRMAAIIHVIRGGLPIAVDEIVNVLDTPRMIFAIKGLYPHNPIIIYPDATGVKRYSSNAASPSDIKLLKQAGFIVRVDRRNPAIRDRIISMNGMFCNAAGERRYLINVDKCPLYVENLEQQAYDDNGLPEKTNNTDHTNDGGGYFINKMFGIVKPDSKGRQLIM